MNKQRITIIVITIIIVVGVFFLSKHPKLKNIQTQSGNITNNPTESAVKNNSATIVSEENTPSNFPLTITQPLNKSIIINQNISVSGKTTPNAEVAINDVDTKADINGNFSVNLMLDEGENIISVIGNDENGNYKEKEITVTYNPQGQ